jgi:Flp pilus assembly pilin Flp
VRRRAGEHGAAAVEFALLLPLLLLILTGVIEFGRVWSQYQTFQGAARQGARCAAVKGEGSTCSITEEITSATPFAPAFGAGGPSVTVDGAPRPNGCLPGLPADGGDLGKDVTVSWVQPFEINIAFWEATTVDTTISGVFRCE